MYYIGHTTGLLPVSKSMTRGRRDDLLNARFFVKICLQILLHNAEIAFPETSTVSNVTLPRVPP